jgi:hypothetical protein
VVHLADLRDSAAGKQLLPLVRKHFAGKLADLEKELGVHPRDVERVTLVIGQPGGEPLAIIRTGKDYDPDAVRKALGDNAEEKEVRGKSLWVAPGSGQALYLAGGRVFVRGPVWALQSWLDEGRLERERGALRDLLPLAAGKHHVVVGLNPAPLRHEVERRDRPDREFLPYKPLLLAESAAITIDLGAESRIELRATFDDEDEAEDGATALKTVLYVVRQGLRRLPRELGSEATQVPRFSGLLKQAERTLRQAAVRREGAVVQASARLRTDWATVGEVAAEMRKAADRARAANNLKQLALAMINYNDTFGALPAAAIYGKDGKPLLSWRVAILPFIEQDHLFKQFHLDEPWDSPHNKKLLARMPPTYAPVLGKAKEGDSTYFQVFVGPEAAFPEKMRGGPAGTAPGWGGMGPPAGLGGPGAQQGTPGGPRPGSGVLPGGAPAAKMMPGTPSPLTGAGFPSRGRRFPVEFPDGTSNTLLIVESARAVPWTKPEDIPYDQKKPLLKLGAERPDGFYAAFADGSVHFIKKSTDEATLRALITPAGGELVDWEKVLTRQER